MQLIVGNIDNPFLVCFNILKIRYPEYDSSIDSSEFLKPDDKVNVFISFESLLNNICCIKDVDKKMILERDFATIITSHILNLAAHYKRFFKQNKLETRVFIYGTDLESTNFINSRFNDEYRSYYLMKYMNNPRYSYLGEQLVSKILPDTRKISEFLPQVYFINGNNIEGSLIPYIVSEMDKSYKNFIITSDIYETQYQTMDNFLCHYIRKSVNGSSISRSIEKTLSLLFSDRVEDDYSIFNNAPYYMLLLSCVGDKKRSIDPIKGLGVKTIMKLINRGLTEKIITEKTDNIELLKDIVNEDIREDLLNNFNCINLKEQYKLLSKEDIFNIEKQIIDRSDNSSLLKLNSTRFYNHQLMLEELTM